MKISLCKVGINYKIIRFFLHFYRLMYLNSIAGKHLNWFGCINISIHFFSFIRHLIIENLRYFFLSAKSILQVNEDILCLKAQTSLTYTLILMLYFYKEKNIRSYALFFFSLTNIGKISNWSYCFRTNSINYEIQLFILDKPL